MCYKNRKSFRNLLSLILMVGLLFSYSIPWKNAVYAATGMPTPVNDLFSRASLNNISLMNISSDPASNTGVNLDSTVYLYFSHGVPVNLASASVNGALNSDLIKIEKMVEPLTPVTFTAANAAGTGNQPVILTFDELLPNTQYKITLMAGITANNSEYSASDVVIGFTTRDIAQPAGEPSLTGAAFTGTTVDLKGLSADAAYLEYRIAADGVTFNNWSDLSVAGTTASIPASNIQTGTGKVEVRVKAEGSNPPSASASAAIYAAWGADIPVMQDIPVVYENGLTADPNQLQSGGVSTINIRNANSEIPDFPYDLEPKSGLASAFYGVTAKGPDGPADAQITLSMPVTIPVDYNVSKVGVYLLDKTFTYSHPFHTTWIYQTETDRSEMTNNIIKIPVSGFGSGGKDQIFGVFHDPYYTVNTVNVYLDSLTDSSIRLKISAQDYGIAKFRIYRNGEYLGETSEPIIQNYLMEYQTAFTDIPPAPGTYQYTAAAVDGAGNEYYDPNHGITVFFGDGLTDDAAAAIAYTKAALASGRIPIGYAAGDSADCVTQDIKLPSTLNGYNTHISWHSDNTEVISNDGKVTKPANADSIQTTLTATITYGDGYYSDAFILPVNVCWTETAHVKTIDALQAGLSRSIVKTLIVDQPIQIPVDSIVDLDCQGKTIRSGFGEPGIFQLFSANSALNLSNANIDAYGTPGQYVIGCSNTSENSATLKIDHVDFYGMENKNYAIKVEGPANLTVTNCSFMAAKTAAIDLAATDLWNEGTNAIRFPNMQPLNATISNNIFNGEGKSGYAIKAYYGQTTIQNNTISGFTDNNERSAGGIFVSQDSEMVISDNIIQNCKNGVVVFTGETILGEAYATSTNKTATGIPTTVYTKTNQILVQTDTDAADAGNDLIIANQISVPADGNAKSVSFYNSADLNNVISLFASSSSTAIPPVLNADADNSTIGQDITLTFADDQLWRSAIKSIKINNILLPADKYIISAGCISISGDVFPTNGNYSIKIEANGFAPACVNQAIALKFSPQLALASPFIRNSNLENPEISLTFTDDPVWRAAITSVTSEHISVVDTVSDSCSYIVSPGSLTVALNKDHIFDQLKITVTADGYADSEIIVYPLLTPPELTPASSGNSAGSPIDITFSHHNADWCSAIYDVKVDGVSMQGDQCVINTGNIHFFAGVFTEAKTYTITISAGKPNDRYYVDAVVEQVILPAAASPELVLNPDNTDNCYSLPIDLTYVDSELWRNAITEISSNGMALDNTQYSITEGNIRLNAGVFTSAGNYTIAVKATGFNTVITNQLVTEPVKLIASPLTADTSNNVLGHAIDITFEDNPTWRSAISGIRFEGIGLLTAEQYFITPGNIHIAAEVFTNCGKFGNISFQVFADGYYPVNCFQTIMAAPTLNPPTLVADRTGNVIGNTVNITFQDSQWRSYISDIVVNGTRLDAGQYVITPGNIQIDGSNFATPGEYTITISAYHAPNNIYNTYYDASVTQTTLSPKYQVTADSNSVYTAGETKGITTMTVNEGVTGYQYFTINTTPLIAYYKKPVVAFVHLRNNVQLTMSASCVSSDLPDYASAGFNVKAGDVIKAYVVDALSNDINFNPNVFQ